MTDATTAQEKRFYDYADLQRRWGVSRSTIGREVRKGRLRRVLVAGCVRFSAREVSLYEQLIEGEAAGIPASEREEAATCAAN